MAITLITGVPGSGKTLKVVSEIKKVLSSYRYVYVHAISGLKLEHEIVVCSSKTCDFCTKLSNYDSYKKVADWDNFADVGSVIIIDEVQHVYRASGSACVESFEHHRHKGLDFFILTQHPMFINPDLRRLVGKHIHLLVDFFGRRQYEWSECSQNLTKSNAIKSKYILDKNLFELYESATVHTKIQRMIPWQLYVVIFGLIISVVIGVPVLNRMFFSDSVAQTQVLNERVVSDRDVVRVGSVGSQGPGQGQFESLPESDFWHVDSMQNYDFNEGKAHYDLKKDKKYRLVTYDGYQRYVSAKSCQVVDDELMCNVGGKLVASWTGRDDSKQKLASSADKNESFLSMK